MSLESIESGDSSCDIYEDFNLPTMEIIVAHKRINIGPSCFVYGCVCGHNVEFRPMTYETKKYRTNNRSGITIKPKTSPIICKLRQ
jgi:hypothetical protein